MYLADRTDIPRYKLGATRGFARPVGLIIELSTSDSYPNGALVSDGFCGEHLETAGLGDGRLYRISEANKTENSENERPWGSDRRHYFVIAEINSKPIAAADNRPPYDLEDETKDLCLKTKSGMFLDTRDSNIVRVSHVLIDRALRGTIRPTIPKIDSSF